jgi:hypothetical protein
LNQSGRYALITQQLKLVYNDSSENRIIFINLDKNDLHKLKEQIERAIAKEEILKKDYDGTYSFIEIGN